MRPPSRQSSSFHAASATSASFLRFRVIDKFVTHALFIMLFVVVCVAARIGIVQKQNLHHADDACAWAPVPVMPTVNSRPGRYCFNQHGLRKTQRNHA